MLPNAPHTDCSICGRTLTLNDNRESNSCNVPSHWQAAGLLSAEDYYSLARIAARATTQDKQDVSQPLVSNESDY